MEIISKVTKNNVKTKENVEKIGKLHNVYQSCQNYIRMILIDAVRLINDDDNVKTKDMS